MWGGALVGFVQEMSRFASTKIAYQAIEDGGQEHQSRVGLEAELKDQAVRQVLT